ncbi:TonB-dependent receptor [Nitrospirillum iridis]|uniref:TonB-dependent receptor n=1 Tax=Nitrospirillum iridis TaxID=765888 RepID=A0A7X0EEG6_9PROT|nr:TonB-dependent receptor [Nitrospirillum iridis]MBB6253872.1 TonB-dependent receptor [Nitrospirillum iridis]
MKNLDTALRHTLRGLRASASALALAAAALTVTAPTARAAQSVTQFAIAAGDLRAALNAYSRATGLQVLADPALLDGKRTDGVTGGFSAQEALLRLLAGTGLDYTQDGDSIVLKVGVTKTAAPTPSKALAASPLATSDTSPLEEIVVTGFAGSVTRALDTKRMANNVLDAISAEDIGKFPSQNVAEAMQHIPGVSISRDRGEGLFVRIRGLGPDFEVTTLNGRSMAVNENVRDSGQSGRNFRFDTLPSELVSGIEVVKSPLASQDEGAIGGLVNIRTFRPLELGDVTFAGSASGSYAQLADAADPHVSALTSWTNDTKTFGALLSAVYDERTVRQDRVLSTNWTLYPNGIDTNGDGKADSGPVIDASGVRPTLELQHSRRVGMNAAAQWAPNDNLEIGLDVLFTRLNMHYDEKTYSADWTISKAVPGSVVIKDGAVVAATAPVSVQIGREESDLLHTNYQVGLNGKYRIDGWTLSADGAYNRADSGTPTPIRRSRILGSAGQVSFSMPSSDDGVPSLNYLTADLNSITLLPGRRLEWRTENAKDTEGAVQVDAEHDLDWGPLSKIRIGAKYRDRGRDYDRRDLIITQNIAGQYFPSSYYDTFPVSGFLSSASGTLPRTWLVPDTNAFFSRMDQSLLNQALTAADQRNSYKVTETIGAGYVMADIATTLFGLPLRGDAGVRVTNTDQVSSGSAASGTKAIPVRYERVYTNALPSANLVLEVRPDLQLRVAASKVITRPSLSSLGPQITLNSSNTIFTATGGNPQLRPYEAWQYDASAEWYFTRSSALIADFFYKDIGTFTFNQVTPLVVDGQSYLLTAPVNGGGAHVIGGEIAYQQLFTFLPSPFDGLGFLANMTITNSAATYHDITSGRFFEADLAGVARHSYNLTAFYEKGPIGLRAAYSWTGNILNQVGTNGLSSVNDRAFGTLDLNATYAVDDHLTLTAEAMNVTGTAQSQYVNNGLFATYTDFGRTFRVGIRAKY